MVGDFGKVEVSLLAAIWAVQQVVVVVVLEMVELGSVGKVRWLVGRMEE